MCQRGFTLLELILVLVIGAAASVIVVRMAPDGVRQTELKAAARTVMVGLRQARAEAVAKRRDATITIDLEQKTFTLDGLDGTSRVVKFPDKIALKLFTAESELKDDKRGSIRFFSDGSSTGGRVTLSAGERQFEVDVDWLTGRVRILDQAG